MNTQRCKRKRAWLQEPGHVEAGATLQWLPELTDEAQGRPSARKMYFDTVRRPFADHVGPVELFLTPGVWLRPGYGVAEARDKGSVGDPGQVGCQTTSRTHFQPGRTVRVDTWIGIESLQEKM